MKKFCPQRLFALITVIVSGIGACVLTSCVDKAPSSVIASSQRTPDPMATTQPLDFIAGELGKLSCMICHTANSAKESTAKFVNYPAWEAKKAMAYRHKSVVDELERRYGHAEATRLLQYAPPLQTASINSSMTYEAFEYWFVDSITRDGEVTREILHRDNPDFGLAMRAWQAQGFALPQNVIDAVICELRTDRVVPENSGACSDL